ncbi:MAG: protein translocase subunit SecD, partial [Candidatus Puniceispirillaceae bacterium]
MLQFEAWKKTLVILVAALGIIYAAPNLLPVERDGGGILPGQKINLGLDLQGGSHLLLRVDMDAVVEERLESVAETIRQEFRGRKIRFSGLDVRNAQVRVRLRDTGDKAEARTVFEEFSRFVDIVDESGEFHIEYNEPGLAALQ